MIDIYTKTNGIALFLAGILGYIETHWFQFLIFSAGVAIGAIGNMGVNAYKTYKIKSHGSKQRS